MLVHIHTCAGCGGYFKLSGANPVLLDAVINDPPLHKTKFVFVHGGPPYTHVTGFLLSKPNVYADFSEQTWLYGVRALAANIRDWLEWYPEKVLFGTDLYPDTPTPEIGWEEIGWQATDISRRALTLALTGMMHDGEITRERALELVVRDAAGLPGRHSVYGARDASDPLHRRMRLRRANPTAWR